MDKARSRLTLTLTASNRVPNYLQVKCFFNAIMEEIAGYTEEGSPKVSVSVDKKGINIHKNTGAETSSPPILTIALADLYQIKFKVWKDRKVCAIRYGGDKKLIIADPWFC